MRQESLITRDQTIYGKLLEHALQRPFDTAIIDMHGRTIGWKALVDALEGTESRLGLNTHESMRIAVSIENSVVNSIVLLAACKQHTVCPLSYGQTYAELCRDLVSCKASKLIGSARIIEKMGGHRSENFEVIEIDGSNQIGDPDWEWQWIQESIQLGRKLQEKTSSCKSKRNRDYAFVFLTSGSTGRPKRVALTDTNILASCKGISMSLSLSREDTCLSMWEQHHIGGVTDLLIAPLLAGSRVLIAGSFNERLCLTLLSKYPITWFQCVPSTLHALVHEQIKSSIRATLSDLRLIRSVASPLSIALKAEAEQCFGVKVLQTYGMTEAAPLIASTGIAVDADRPGSVGKPICTEVRILTESGLTQNPDVEGEIAIRGDNVISSYESEETAVHRQDFIDEWFITGDLGRFDADGFLYLLGRTRAQINRGGEKVSPLEIEGITMQCRGVKDAHVVGVPHKTLGEQVGLIIAPMDEDPQVINLVLERVKDELSAHKVPSKVWVSKRLIRSDTGKISRKLVEDILREPSVDLASTPLGLSKKGQRQPNSAMLKEVCIIWAEELGVSKIHEGSFFYDVGGDSLSSVRIAAAAEARFNIHYTNDLINRMVTPLQMAIVTEDLIRDELARHNRSIGNTQASKGDTKAEVEFVISTGYSGSHLIEELTQEELIEHLIGLPSTAGFQAVIERVRNYSTPQEVLAVCDGVINALSEGFASTNPDNDSKTNHCIRLVDTISRNKPTTDSSNSWERLVVAPTVSIYQYKQRNIVNPQKRASTDRVRGKKSLVVAMAGYFNRMMLPMDIFLTAVDGNSYDILYVWDDSRQFYSKGVSQFGSNPKDFSNELGQYVASLNYGRIVGFGVSMGAIPCCTLSLKMYWDASIMIGPDSLGKYPGYLEMLESALSRDTDSVLPKIIVGYGLKNRQDCEAVAELRKIVPAQPLAIPDCDSHNVLWHAHCNGYLRRFMDRLFELTQVESM